MKVKVYNKNLESTEEMDLNPKIFDVKPVSELIQQAVRIQMNNARSSLANTKTRGEVRGGGKKPWKQKGTGRARAGSTRSPIWRHGGITFGPRANRNYELKMNKKEWRKALYMVLSDKAATNNFLVFSEFSLSTPKTKEMAAMLKSIKEKIAAKTSRKFLVLLPKNDQAIEQATRNLKDAKVIHANSLNIVDLLKYDAVLALKGSLEIIEKTYLK
jgi:large subunit ribosomal protein L4